MTWKFGSAAMLALSVLMAGCVAYPQAGYVAETGYYPAPYYGPSYVVAPPPMIGVWGSGWRGGPRGGWGGGPRGGWGAGHRGGHWR